MRATFLACCRGKVDINLHEDVENPCVHAHFNYSRSGATPCCACRARETRTQIPGQACWCRPRGSRLLSQQFLVTQRVGAGNRTDSDLGSIAGDSPSFKVRMHTPGAKIMQRKYKKPTDPNADAVERYFGCAS
jgi:hypothetical protein